MSDADLRLSLALALIAVIYICALDRVDWFLALREARKEARKRAKERAEQAIGPDDHPTY